MKRILSITFAALILGSAAFAQRTDGDKNPPASEKGAAHKTSEEKASAGKVDNESTFDADGRMTRGANLSASAKTISLADVLKKPENFAGKTVAVSGVIVRSCKKEGCWMELAPAKNAQSVRVTFKDHAFFIPLDAAGLNARAEGVFSVKTLSKEKVEHLQNEDGAKFDRINADGTVTEISFEANGVELSKPAKQQ